MNNVNRTLYIPLRGKAYVSRKGIILRDPRAEEIWAAEGFSLKGKAASKWLAYYMGMRSAVFDRWVEAQKADLVLHLGCGLDSRSERVENTGLWFDVDFPDVIAERKKYYEESEHYHMIGADIRNSDWLAQVPGGNAVVVMEGVGMYLRPEELRQTLAALCGYFERVSLLMDCYTEFAAKASKYKNPINQVGVTQVYGMDDPCEAEAGGLRFLREHDMTPVDLIEQLPGMERRIFRKVFAGKFARKLYRLYEYRK